jgi:ADP-dependent NAD(P)H-hydrate dehydratase
MTAAAEDVTPTLLRGWRLAGGEGSKHERGRIVVVGGARKTPGAVRLAGAAALRVGAGHLTLGVAESVSAALAVAMPEAGVVPLTEDDRGSVIGSGAAEAIRDAVQSADVVVIGPGLDDADQAAELAIALLPDIAPEAHLVLDAFALGSLASWHDEHQLPANLVLTPNGTEAELLLERPLRDDLADGRELADRFRATVCCQGVVTAPDGRQWRVGAGHGGLATSGSGDVLAGAIAGLLERSEDAAQACCWAAYAHAAAGDRLAAGVGRLSFLAREIADTLPLVLLELGS